MQYFTCDFPYEKNGCLMVKFKNSVTKTNKMLQVTYGNVNRAKFAIRSTNIELNIRETQRPTKKKKEIQSSRYFMYHFLYTLLYNIFIHMDLESFNPKSLGAHKVRNQ